MSAGPWFVRFAGRRSGPFDAERLRVLARRGNLTRLHSVSTDGRAWSPATSLRAVFNDDGTVATDPLPSIGGEEGERPEMPEGLGDLPDGGTLELPRIPLRSRSGSARVRPVVLAALGIATIVLALPTSRDDAGALAWWWGEGPMSIAIRGLASLAACLGWVVAVLPPEPARSASVAGVAAILSAASAASLLSWAPSSSLLAPIVPLSAIVVALDAAGAASARAAGRFAAVTAIVLGLGALAVGISGGSPLGIASASIGLLGAGGLSWAGFQAGGDRPGSGARAFWGGVCAASAAMASLFVTALGGLLGDVPMQGADAGVVACLVLAFATVSWAAVHETVESIHELPRSGMEPDPSVADPASGP